MVSLGNYVGDFNKENQFWFVCGSSLTDMNRGNISPTEISSCCLFALKGVRARRGSQKQPSIPREIVALLHAILIFFLLLPLLLFLFISQKYIYIWYIKKKQL